MEYQEQEQKRRVIRLQRVATGLVKDDILAAFNKAYKEVRMLLLDSFDDSTSIVKLNALTREVNRTTEAIIADGWSKVTEGLEGVADKEVSFVTTVLGESAKQPAIKNTINVINRSIMSVGNSTGAWSEFVKKNTSNFVARYDSVIKKAWSQNRLTPESPITVKNIMSEIKLINGGINKNQAEALTRTGLSHYSSQARQYAANQNKQLIVREVPLVAFDNRTSDTCIQISAKYYPKGWPAGESPIGYPPYHFNCRTTIAYATDDNQIDFDADQTIESFMRSQPKRFVEETLGKKKADLFLRGELNLKKLTDATGRSLPVADL